MDILTQILDLIETEYPDALQDRTKLERVIRVNFGRDRHYIASPNEMDRAARDLEVRRLLSQGLNSEEVAVKVGITAQRVRQIRGASAVP